MPRRYPLRLMILPHLKRERELRFLTQRQLAALAGVSHPTIVAAEARRQVLPRVAGRLTAALERIPVSELSRELQTSRRGAVATIARLDKEVEEFIAANVELRTRIAELEAQLASRS